MSGDMLFDRTSAGLYMRVHPNVYLDRAAPFTHETRLFAAHLACGLDSVLSRRSAAVVHRFSGIRRWKPEITTPHMDLPRIDGITIHRTRHLRPGEIAVVNGFPVTSKGRTAVDLCGVLPYEEAEESISQSVIRKVLAIPDLLGGIELGGGRGCTGTVACRAIAAGAIEFDGLESVLEHDVAKIIDRARVPRPVRQYEVTCADGRQVRLDNAWPDLRLAAEADGMRWHATPGRLRATQARSRSIQGTGWVHLTYGWYDAHQGAVATQHDIEWHFAERRRLAA
jgi:hypothetical protein